MKIINVFLLLLVLCVGVVQADDHQPRKAVLVTGASSGLGLKMTEVLSENGFFVYAGARKDADMKRLSAMDNVQAVRLDVLKPEQISAAAELIKAQGRGLYGLINNAGIAVFGPMIEVPADELNHQLNVNVVGPYRVLQAFAPMIIESKGRIATTGSIAGILSSSMFGPYAMSKHAIEAYTDALADEMARFGVQVSVIEPGNYGSKIGATAKQRILTNDYWSESTRYADERNGLLASLDNLEKGADPLPVAMAALDIMQSEHVKPRYMVVPNVGQADSTVRGSLRKAIQMNHAQPYQFDRETLIKMLDEELANMPAPTQPEKNSNQ